jgi:hypothetical protein
MVTNLFDKLTERYPFITIIAYGADRIELVGLIQNSDTVITSFYNYGALKTDEEKKLFLSLAEQWYFESNRQIPINIYLKHEWAPFKYVLKTFITKEIEIMHGPLVSLSNLNQKRSKRRSITLLRKMS